MNGTSRSCIIYYSKPKKDKNSKILLIKMVNDMFFHLWGVTIEYYIIIHRVVQFDDTINCNIIASIYIYIYIQLHLHII